MDRRTFLTGTATALASAATLGVLAGCSPKGATADSDGNEAKTADAAEQSINVDEEIDTDIVVVGGGISGLSAAVRAAELGARVTLMEIKNSLGGNGSGTEGIFAVGSRRQKEQGIDVTLAEIVSGEQDFFKYKVDALLWKDLVENSADMVEWLESQNVEFAEEVNEYPPLGKKKVYHWFKENATSSYIKPMSQRVTDLGVKTLLETRAFKLSMDGETVTGVYGRGKGDKVVKVNAKAVILASGGFIDNPDRLRNAGMEPDQVFTEGFGDHVGDGLVMAIEAGAKDKSDTCAFLREATVQYQGSSCAYPLSIFFFNEGSLLWVNGDGERFANENCLSVTTGCMSNAISNQKNPYGIFTQSMIEDFKLMLDGVSTSALEECLEMVERNDGSMFVADTIEDLAQQTGLPVDALASTLERYNGFCEAGADEDFAKDADKLVKLEPPFYAGKFKYCVMASIGGIATNRKAEAVKADGSSIPGLYAVGLDGCELYYGTYTISVPGSCNSNNVYSGKNAAQNAVDYLKR